MFRRKNPDEPETVIVIRPLTEVDEELRAEADPDPFVEEATERLRTQLKGLSAVDEWGRPVAWRQVARIALGELTTPKVRDAVTADRLEKALSVSPVDVEREGEWHAFFKAVDEGDRLLRDESRPLPEG